MARIKTWADVETLKADGKLSAVEEKLIACCVAGELCVLGHGNRPESPKADNTISADLLRYLILGGCEDCRVDETGVRLRGGWITGSLDLSFAKAEGQTELGNCHFTEQLEARQTRFDLLDLSGSALPGINADGVAVTGDVILRTGFHATGEVSLSGAKIGGQLECSGGRFEGGGGDALNAQGAEVTGAVFLVKGFHATGEVSLSGAKIGGPLVCRGGRFDGGGGDALDAPGAEVTGNVFLNRGFHATGKVSLSGAKIGGILSCRDGRFDGGGGDALNAQGAEVTGSMFLNKGFHATGTARLSGATIGGSIDCSGGRFEVGGGNALNAQDMSAGSLMWRGVMVTSGRVDLTDAHCADLLDDLPSWPAPGRLRLDGFSYDRISGSFTDAAQRLDWLQRGDTWNGVFFPQPYEQLAKVLGQMGHDADRRKVLVRKETLLRAFARHQNVVVPNGDISVGLRSIWADLHNLWQGFWGWAIRAIVGYGYHPFRSLWHLLGLIVIGWYLAMQTWTTGQFAPNSDVIIDSAAWQEVARDPTIANPAEVWSRKAKDPVTLRDQGQGLDYESFYALAYSFDLVVPLIDLGQEAAWAPSKDRGFWGRLLWWARWPLAILGWIITALCAAAVTGIIRRE